MKPIPLQQLTVGQRLSFPLFHPSGVVLLEQGEEVTQAAMAQLRDRGLHELLAPDGDADLIAHRRERLMVPMRWDEFPLEAEIPFEIYSAEGDLLLPAGTVMTSEMFDTLSQRSTGPAYARRDDAAAELEQAQAIRTSLSLAHRAPSSPAAPQAARKYDRWCSATSLALLHDVRRAAVRYPVLQSRFGMMVNECRFLWPQSWDVGLLALALAQRLGLAPSALPPLAWAALTHDIAMPLVPKETLLRPGDLQPCDWGLIHEHVTEAVRTLARLPAVPREALSIVADHHERLDGSGYPRGRPAALLEEAARILQLADAFAAATAPRPYRPAKTLASALSEMRLIAEAGIYDARAVEALAGMVQQDLCCSG